MIGFLGEYEVTIDAKGRFLLPGGLRKQFAEDESQFVINRGIEKNLNLYTLQSWEEEMKRMSKWDNLNPKVRKLKTFLLGGASKVELDSAGRILIPASLKEHAGLVRDIMISPDSNKVIIWDSVKYKKLFEETTEDELSSLGEEVSKLERRGIDL